MKDNRKFNKKFSVSFYPTSFELKQLQQWMLIENESNIGIYHYVDPLNKHFRDHTMAIIKKDNTVLGFSSWSVHKTVARIDNVAIKHSYRKMGIGTVLVQELFVQLYNLGILAVHLECAPSESEHFWKKVGCERMPLIWGVSDKGRPCLYKTLLPGLKQNRVGFDRIEIYNERDTPAMSWPVKFKTGTSNLVRPIIMPVHFDWLICRTTMEPDAKYKIKNFHFGRYYVDPFLIITELMD